MADAGPPDVDLVVGLPTYNCARTVGHAAQAIRSAFAALPSERWRVVVADGGSSDGTGERVREAIGAGPALIEAAYAPQAEDVLSAPYHRLPGRARALAVILEHARRIGARACIVLDAFATSVAPEWILRLARPALAGEADLVVPRYARHPFSGALVHGVLYPMFRALYGARLREPIAADFACSAAFADMVLDSPVWQSESGQIGIDQWLAATAVTGGFRVGQVPLGAKVRDERGEPDLGTVVAQTVGFLFTDMERRVEHWQRVRSSRAIPDLADPHDAPPPRPEVDASRLVESFRLGYRELHDVWSEVMPPLATLQWRRLSTTPVEAFRVDDALWARTVYDFAMGHRLGVIARGHLLGSLVPLYLGWLASFVVEVGQAPAAQAEARIERLCLAFEAEKPYLISMWRWPERFKPVRIRR